jgi:two-component system sensor histidine kinase and response regulator WspE
MLELFRVEAENQTAIMSAGLLELERGAGTKQTFEMLMRAAHSLKGAARIVGLQAVGRVAHALEDCFVAAQSQTLELRQPEIDLLLRGIDLLSQLARLDDSTIPRWEEEHGGEIGQVLEAFAKLLPDHKSGPPRNAPPPSLALKLPETPEQVPDFTATRALEASQRVVRLGADNLNRLLGLAGESLVESRWLNPFAQSLRQLKRRQAEAAQHLDGLRRRLEDASLPEHAGDALQDLSRRLAANQLFLAERLQELDMFDRRTAHLSQRLYLEALRTRMRPFSEGVRRFPRMVRDLARTLGKEVRLEILGESTQVDRDILERLEVPLAHLLRNAVDHGCESPAERRQAGKPEEGVIRIEARHSAGMLLIVVSDDGAGVPVQPLREAVIRKKLAPRATVDRLAEAQLLEFLFLPGFTLKDKVTEISGRGVGLDIVDHMVKGLRGAIRLSNQPGHGLRIQLQLPLTLSVLRALLVEVAGEPYAIPLTRIHHTIKLAPEQIHTLEGWPHFLLDGQPVGLLPADQVFEYGGPAPLRSELPVILLGERSARYGLIVDRFVGERELVVQPLDPRLGKVQDINSAAVMEDGTPVLIVEVDDLLQSIEQLLAKGSLQDKASLRGIAQLNDDSGKGAGFDD